MLTGPTLPVIEGALDVLRDASCDIAPLIKADSTCGQWLTSECYATLKRDMLEHLKAASPVDGVLLLLHGSATCESIGDVEGDLLHSVREIVGGAMPIVATLDCHAHVTELMVQSADALLAWQTYPHIDTREIGRKGANVLVRTMRGECRPTMALAKSPVLVSGVHGGTVMPGPFAEIMAMAIAAEAQPSVLSASALLVHPYLDLADMGGGGLVVTDNDMNLAANMAEAMADVYWEKRFELDVETITPQQAIRLAVAARLKGSTAKPALLIETADCVGGGAAGDSVATLKALLAEAPTAPAIVPVVDPAAAAACYASAVGERIDLKLGHQLDTKWGSPLEHTFTIERLLDGKFTYRGGLWADCEHDMGPSALIAIGPVQVLVMSSPTYEFGGEQFAAAGVDLAAMSFIVVKNPMNFGVGFTDVTDEYYILDTPGPTPASMRSTTYTRVEGPYFPAVDNIAGFSPRIYLGRDRSGSASGT